MPYLNMMETGKKWRAYRKEGRAQEFIAHFTEALDSKQIKPTELSIRSLALALITDTKGNSMGQEFVEACNPDRRGMTHMSFLEAVDSAAFKTIGGQLLYTRTMEEYEDHVSPVEGLYETIPTRLNGEKIPGVTVLGDHNQTIREGEPFPRAGIGEDWRDTPETVKRGVIIEITKEAIFFDRTNLLLERAAAVGQELGWNKASRIIDMILGVTNNYNWKDTAYDTYQSTTPWVNIVSSNGLSNWSNIDSADQTFANIVHPDTGRPIPIVPTKLLVHKSKRATANWIKNATQVRVDPNANAGTSQYLTDVPNSAFNNGYEVVSHPFIDQRYTAGSVTTTDWFYGDPMKAFSYMENWPIMTEQMPANTYVEWERDIVAGYKTSERGVVAVKNPRYMQKSTA